MLESVLAGVVATRRKLMTRRVQELERLAIRSHECVRNRVEGEVTGESYCSYDVRRNDEGMGGRVSIIMTSEFAIVGREDWK
jgi:hypothetical protein